MVYINQYITGYSSYLNDACSSLFKFRLAYEYIKIKKSFFKKLFLKDQIMNDV